MSEIPYGYCQCGCGQLAPLAKQTSTREGWIKGQPVRFIVGHGSRKTPYVAPWAGAPHLCECGCGQPTSIATATSRRHGRIEGQPVRFVLGHGSRKPVADRFWSHVQKSEDGCWLWTGSKTEGGYGVFCLDRRKEGNTTAHRFSYILHFGPIPNDIKVCHHCDNPGCVRPDHLFAGSHSDNMQDMLKKNRGRWAKK